MNDYLSQDRGMSVYGATVAVTLFGVGTFLGVFFGGWVGQILYNKKKWYVAVWMSGTVALGNMLITRLFYEL